MNSEEQAYFERMIDYKKEIKSIDSGVQQDIICFSAQVRNIARDVLLGEINPKSAKEEISNLIEIIKELEDKEIK
jgi:hypothetical protein